MNSYKIDADLLKKYISSIERVEEEKTQIRDEIKDIYAKAKEHGIDTKALKEIIKLRKMDNAEIIEHEAILEAYKEALGMIEK